ncbi:MAG: isocitrate lyase/phosphoenolpyruvate mutase family protein [Comamonadaceae bacterium]|nr:MAG: isocitrate lyase/phosphoenolpyruvate mutase family protein [Comamonadaceae bacterium]
MTATPASKAAALQALHQSATAFIIPNAWDAGSARLLQGLGFAALATSSGAAAMALGRRDGQLNREEAIAHGRALAQAVDIPVSADLENGFGDSPQDAALTIRMAGEAGLAGGSIEDSNGSTDQPLYDIQHAADRVAAAVEAAKSLGFPFQLTARAENFFRGRPDLDDTIARLQAYEKAGADVLFAPALPDLAAVRAVCSAVTKPVNFMVAIPGKSFTVGELQAAGVRRISLATSLYRAAMSGLLDAAREAKERGTFTYLEKGSPTSELIKLMKGA